MRCHILIAQIRHSERYILCVVACSFIVFSLTGCLLSRGEYAKKEEVLRVTLICIEGAIYVFYSCLTLVSLRITFEGKLQRK